MSLKKADELVTSREAFFALYKDDRWKQFSRRVRDFHANQCHECRATDKQTQVHHWKYYPGRMPWEYDMGEVCVICADCHERYHEHLQNFRKYIFPRLGAQAFQVLNGALTVGLNNHKPLELAYAIASLVSSPRSVARFLEDWKKDPPKAA